MTTKTTPPKSTYSAPRLQVVGSIAGVAERLVDAIDCEVLAGLDRAASVSGGSQQRLH